MRLSQSFGVTVIIGIALLVCFASSQPIPDASSTVATHTLEARIPKGGGGVSISKPGFSKPSFSKPSFTRPQPSLPKVTIPKIFKPKNYWKPKPPTPKTATPKSSVLGSPRPMPIPVLIPGGHAPGHRHTGDASSSAISTSTLVMTGLLLLVTALLL